MLKPAGNARFAPDAQSPGVPQTLPKTPGKQQQLLPAPSPPQPHHTEPPHPIPFPLLPVPQPRAAGREEAEEPPLLGGTLPRGCFFPFFPLCRSLPPHLGALVLEGVEEEQLCGGVHRHLSGGGREALPEAGRALPRAGAAGAITGRLWPHGAVGKGTGG